MPRSTEWARVARAYRGLFAALLPLPCYRCGKPVKPTDEWDLDHKDAVDEGGNELSPDNLAPSHSSCNRSHGATLTNVKRSHNALRTRKW